MLGQVTKANQVIKTKQYRYKLGQAIVFGDGFVHSTQPGEAPQTLAFLCFTFGSKNMPWSAWDSARGYREAQCKMYAIPSGRLVRSRLVL